MRNKYIIGAILFECVLIYFQLSIDFGAYHYKQDDAIFTHRLSYWNDISEIGFLFLLIPLIFLFETLLIKFPFTEVIKWILSLQSLLAVYGLLVSVLAVHGLFKNNIIYPMGYFILIYNGIFVLWSVLLGFPPTRDLKVINWIFERRKEKIEIRN